MLAFTKRAHERRDAETVLGGSRRGSENDAGHHAGNLLVDATVPCHRHIDLQPIGAGIGPPRAIRGTETLKPPRALGPGEALVVVQITLVGERQAQAGHEFIYRGPQPECTPCKVRSACLNQDLGRRYRVTRVRDVSHPCLLNEERARVVEVEPIAPDCSLSARVGVEGAVLAYEKLVCSNGACPNFRLCHPVGVEPGMKIRVVEIGRELECPLGYSLVSAKVAYGN